MDKGSETKARLWNSNYTKTWIATFMLYFSFMLLMPLFPLYLRDTFGANKETIGIVLSGYTIAALFIRPSADTSSTPSRVRSSSYFSTPYS